MGGTGYQVIGLVIDAAIGAWVYSDAKKRGMNAAGWGIGAFLLCIVILPLYLIIRKPVVTAGGMPGYPPGTVVTQLPPQYIPPPIAGNAGAVPPPAPPVAGTWHFCGQCGQRYEGTVKFCPICGAPQG
jgi:hypothetical protein